MATTSATLSLSSSSTLIDGKVPRQASATASAQCVTLPTLPPPPVPSSNRPPSRETWKTTVYCRKIARNVVSMATGDAPAEVATNEMPEIVKTIQEAWDKLEDKYAVTSLAFAGVIGLCASSGMISAIDRLPLVPVVLELVGISYTGKIGHAQCSYVIVDRTVLDESSKSRTMRNDANPSTVLVHQI